jgi:hypothetical protein
MDSSTNLRTFDSYKRRFSKNNFAASLFAGELGFGSFNNERMDVNIAHTS